MEIPGPVTPARQMTVGRARRERGSSSRLTAEVTFELRPVRESQVTADFREPLAEAIPRERRLVGCEEAGERRVELVASSDDVVQGKARERADSVCDHHGRGLDHGASADVARSNTPRACQSAKAAGSRSFARTTKRLAARALFRSITVASRSIAHDTGVEALAPGDVRCPFRRPATRR